MPSADSPNNEARWYLGWFDSPYYPILYAHRDEAEARRFLDRLLVRLSVRPPARVIDVGCGWGRHARYLARKGFSVLGIDANEKVTARLASDPPRLQFITHDVLEPFPAEWGTFDAALSLFTAFGYFMRQADHLRALRHIYAILKPSGLFVLDFMNVTYALCRLKPSESIRRNGIHFDIRRTYSPPFILKDITVNDGKRLYRFRERIWAFWPEELNTLLRTAGFRIVDQWGDYDLSAFNESCSPRLIFLAQKV